MFKKIVTILCIVAAIVWAYNIGTLDARVVQSDNNQCKGEIK